MISYPRLLFWFNLVLFQLQDIIKSDFIFNLAMLPTPVKSSSFTDVT